VPALIIEPVPELINPFFYKFDGGPVVEVRVELVNDALILENRELQ
jgi:hypothetical protein